MTSASLLGLYKFYRFFATVISKFLYHQFFPHILFFLSLRKLLAFVFLCFRFFVFSFLLRAFVIHSTLLPFP